MKKQFSVDLGQRLQKLRLALGLQQNEMARAAGLNPGYLSELISGKRDNPGIETILKIAVRFNVNLNYLLLGEGEMFLPDKDKALKKEEELKLYIEDIDDLNRVIEKSNIVKNTVMAFTMKFCLANEDTIRKEMEILNKKKKENKKPGKSKK